MNEKDRVLVDVITDLNQGVRNQSYHIGELEEELGQAKSTIMGLSEEKRQAAEAHHTTRVENEALEAILENIEQICKEVGIDTSVENHETAVEKLSIRLDVSEKLLNGYIRALTFLGKKEDESGGAFLKSFKANYDKIERELEKTRDLCEKSLPKGVGMTLDTKTNNLDFSLLLAAEHIIEERDKAIEKRDGWKECCEREHKKRGNMERKYKRLTALLKRRGIYSCEDTLNRFYDNERNRGKK
jgi:hypothetical protein